MTMTSLTTIALMRMKKKKTILLLLRHQRRVRPRQHLLLHHQAMPRQSRSRPAMPALWRRTTRFASSESCVPTSPTRVVTRARRLWSQNISRRVRLEVSNVSYPFLPHDAMHKCDLCSRPVYVCPSVTLVYCIQTAEDIVKPFISAR